MGDNPESFILVTEGLVKTYGRTPALRGLTLQVPYGSIFGFLGPNGAGKTTTLRIAMGLVKWDAGTVQVLGLSPKKNLLEIQRRVGYVSETRSLLDWLSVSELIAFNRSFYPSWSREKEVQYLKRFELNPKAKVGRLSLGERTRLCLLLSFAQEPDLLLLDEPTNGMDPVFRQDFFRILREEYLTPERAVVLSTHNLPEVEKICDRISIIREGTLLYSVDLEEARESFHRLVLRGKVEVPIKGILRKEFHEPYTVLWVHSAQEEIQTACSSVGITGWEIQPVALSELYTLLVEQGEPVTTGAVK